MTVGVTQTFAPYDGLNAVYDTATAVTFDLERGEMVLIVAVAGAATVTISYITPAYVCLNSAAFTLTIYGSGFTGASVAKVGGSARTTAYVSATKITATIPASDLLVLGTLAITVTEGATTTNTNYLTVQACGVADAGKGPLSRPQMDHLADIRAADNQLNWMHDLTGANDILRRVSRN